MASIGSRSARRGATRGPPGGRRFCGPVGGGGGGGGGAGPGAGRVSRGPWRGSRRAGGGATGVGGGGRRRWTVGRAPEPRTGGADEPTSLKVLHTASST